MGGGGEGGWAAAGGLYLPLYRTQTVVIRISLISDKN